MRFNAALARRVALILGLSFPSFSAALADGRAVLPPRWMVEAYLSDALVKPSRDDIARAIIPGLGMVPAFVGGASGPPTYLGLGSLADGTSGNISPGLPSGWQPGDYHLLAILNRAASSHAPTGAVSGFTVLGSDSQFDRVGGYYTASLRWRFAQSGDSAPVVPTGSIGTGAVIFGFRNILSATTPSSATTTTDQVSYAYDGASSAGDNRLALQFFFTHRNNGTIADTPASGWSFVSSGVFSSTGSNMSVGLDYLFMPSTANASGTHTFGNTAYRLARKGLFLL